MTAREPIRVLRVIARMNVGGPAWQVTALTRGLDPQQFETRLLVGSVGEGEADYLTLRAPDLPATLVPGLGRAPNPGGDPRALATLVGEMRRFRPHIVHTHTAKAGVLGRIAARIARVPITVHTFHGHLLHGYFSPPVGAAVRATERVLARSTTRLVAVGQRVRDELLAVGIGQPAQYVVVPPGVAMPDPPERREARRRLGIDERAPVVAFVARLTAVKRPDRFVEVARLVSERRSDVCFVVAGDGPLGPEMRRLAAPLGDRAIFLGWCSDPLTVYAAADVVVLTSDNEGMPVSLLEAAAAGTPAVSTDVGSACEVVEHGVTGFIVEPDAAALAEALLRVLDDPALQQRLGEAAAARVERRFSTERLIADTESLYRDLVARGGAG